MQTTQAAEPRLSERKERILKAIVEDYIRTASAVASETLVREHGLGVSSATVRNEMAELEAEGYIYQPHTSAGRIPSELGYRYFVHRLMEEQQIPPSEQLTIRHQFHQVALYRDRWLQLAAAVLARAVRAAAIVSAPQVVACRLKHVEALQMQERLGLLVLVLQDGTVKQQLITLPAGIEQHDLSAASNRLNMLFRGKSRREIVAASRDEPFSDHEAFVLDALLQLMEQIDARDAVDVYHAGLVELLEQPEFARVERARTIVEVLERPHTLRALLPTVPEAGVRVLIGSDNRWDWMRECAIVLARYGATGDVSGVIGVLGPLRLPYAVAIPAVRYVSQLMTELLEGALSVSADPASSIMRGSTGPKPADAETEE
jgi:heat-inducible transcriptional repressor